MRPPDHPHIAATRPGRPVRPNAPGTSIVRKAIILSAGQGTRLLPLTENRPKCLIPVGRRTLIGWQVESLYLNGIREIVVVLGFEALKVEQELRRLARPGLAIRTILNPFYKLADNLGSVFLARHEMTEDFLILNGDTIFEPALLARAMQQASAPVTVTIDRKDRYDEDDMKVQLDGLRLLDIGKTLPLDIVTGEAIGLHLFKGKGPALFSEAVLEAMRAPEGLKAFYLSVVARLARQGHVAVAPIVGLKWGEVDFPPDVERAEALANSWTH
ncbi:MAG: phosphocholine cytidylyltransferase family protein [Alphaproteobacteria bacterium]|nr:phosphocholine cytidylyltransferase family protein [Alphaproteobacteria bacterium]